MRDLHRIRKHERDNAKFMMMVNYYLSKREYETVLGLLRNVNKFTGCSTMRRRVSDLFLTTPYAKEFFGIAETIVGAMSNMVFAGNVNLKTENEEAQKFLNEVYFDGYFMNSVKEAYKTAIATNGKSYLFRNTLQHYNNLTNERVNDEFLDYEVFTSFEVEEKRNQVIRTFYKTVEIFDEREKRNREEVYKFEYIYTINDDETTLLDIIGYDDEDKVIQAHEVKDILGIDTVHESYTYVPFLVLDVGEGMIPNALFLEDSLSLNLYYQDIDLSSAQTHVYIPEHMLLENVLSEEQMRETFNDKYSLRHVVNPGGLDNQGIEVVPGASAINEIERNLALNVIQACLDAKISPVSIGYSLIDKIASNTDIGVQKERNSIRLRENHINKLKIFIAKELVELARLEGIELTVNDIAVIFDPYITPSIETMTNVLSKQVQFGIKSRKQAVQDLNKNELSDKEIEEEYERIKELGTQIDYNVSQREQGRKGENNNLKGSGVEE